MAVVWPSKNNFANGDVLTAANMNNIADTLNVFNPTSATNGQVWVANGAGSGAFGTVASGLTLVSPTTIANTGGTATINTGGTVTFSGACTSISLNGCFTSTYTNYLVLYYNLLPSAQTAPRFRLRVGGTDNTTASSYQRQRADFNATSGTFAALSDDNWELPDIHNVSFRAAYGIYVFQPQVAIQTAHRLFHTGRNASNAFFREEAMSHTQATSYDGFTTYTVAGPTFAGTIAVYGIAK